ncbi:MAG TPA: hypothetical protein VIM96_02670 [Pseudomonadales bacterium]
MNAQVNPWVAALVIALSVAIFGVKFWADGERAHTPAPTFVRATPDGGLWVVMNNDIVLLDADGQYQRTIPLAGLHVTDLVGDIGIFSNGDLLLRAEPAADDTQFKAGQLLRCAPATRECTAWSTLNFSKVFRLYIDADDTVFIADTMHHRVLRRAADGADQGAVHDRVRYPNQLWRAGDALFVTMSDGNASAIQWFAVGKKTLGDWQGSADIGHADGVAAGHAMASDIVRVGDVWWVNLMRSGQKDGGIYRFDSRWNLLGRVALPAGSDPLVMTAYQGDVVVSDFKWRRLLRLAADGSARPDFAPPRLETQLAVWRAQAARFAQYSEAAIIAFGMLLAVGMIAGIAQLRAAAVAMPEPSLIEQSQSVDDPAIQWIDVDPQVRRQQHWVVLAVLFALGAMALTMSPAGLLRTAWPMMGVMVIVAPMLWLHARQLRQRIGVRGELLILQNGQRQTAVGKGERILYSDNHIMIDDVVVSTGNGIKSLFPQDQLMNCVFPLLKQGRYLKASEMQQLLMKRMDPVLMVPVVLILIFVAVFFAAQQGWVHIGVF